MAATEFRLHLWSRVPGDRPPAASFDAESNLEGAALALRQFMQSGYDITAPGPHRAVEAPGGPSRTMMISEVLEWLHRPDQAELVKKENLEQLLSVTLP